MKHSLSVKQRYLVSSLVGFVSCIALGVLLGLFRHHILDFEFSQLMIGFIVALIFRKIGDSIQLKFAITAVIFTFLGLVISDVVNAYDLKGLMNVDLILATFAYSFSYDIASIVWLSYRGLSLYIAYIYSRII